MRNIFSSMFKQRESGLLFLILISILVVGIKDIGFLSLTNWRDILVRSAPVIIVSCGVMMVVLSGEIDISTGSMMALLASILGMTLSSDLWQWNTSLGILAVLIAGTLIGIVSGILVCYGGVPSIIVTLGWLTAFKGLTILIMKGENIGNLPDGLTQACKFGWFSVPLSIWVACIVVLISILILNHTSIGWQLRAAGSSSDTANRTGLGIKKIKIFAFAYTGLLVAIATTVDVPRLPRIESGIGNGFELLIVTCVVVGGVSIIGGKGRLSGVLLACLLMVMIRPMLTFLDLGQTSELWTRAIQGAFILIAVLCDKQAEKISIQKKARISS